MVNPEDTSPRYGDFTMEHRCFYARRCKTLRSWLPASGFRLSAIGYRLVPKLQYLGDSRDAFKWDLLHWLYTRAEPASARLLFVPLPTTDA